MKANKSHRVMLSILILLAASNLAAAGKRGTGLTLLAGWNLFGAVGSDSDYVAGSNDFPATPSCQAPVAGLRLTFGGSRRLSWGLDVRYGTAADVVRRDPSDNETVGVETPRNLTAVLAAQIFMDLGDRLALVLTLGGGAEYRLVEEKTFLSSLGNKIVIPKPEKPYAPLAVAGLGAQYMLGGSLGLVAECRLAFAVRDPAQMIVTPALGLVIGF